MATTRIMPLHTGKGRTVGQAISDIIDYVENPQKTDKGRLITSYACDSRTADAEFVLAKREYITKTGRVRGTDDVIAYHLRQSFVPGEITPEEANRIGCELAQRFTKGNNAFVVCTHTDKAHIHNHIIWNAVTVDCDRKFRNFWGSTKAVRRLNDTICIENGLSIVENPKLHGKSYNKWLGDAAKPSHRELLRVAIDNALSENPESLEALFALLQQAGVQVKKRGKSISLQAPGQDRFVRMDTLGDEYSEAALSAVLVGEKVHQPRRKKLVQAEPKSVNLLVDIQAKLQAGKGAGYARWAKVFNLKQMAKTMNYLSEHGLLEYTVLLEKAQAATIRYGINNIKESELPEKFSGGDYQVLLVAEKYQTGFDEPLLHTMFVDKKLSGVKAVQTLSRLNRTCFGKEDTFVLDFVNSAEEIRAAFEPYYEETEIEETTDANIVYDLKIKLDNFRVYWESEIESFARVFFKPGKKQGNMDFAVLNSFLDPAVDRYKGLEENEQEEFKSTLTKFVRTYTFLTSIVRLDDAEMHKFHAYAKFLLKKLPKRDENAPVFLDDEVALQYYRVQKIFEGSITLAQSEPLPNKIIAGKAKPEEEKSPLSELIEHINEKFGTDFTNIDKVLEQIVSDMDANEELRTQAKNNSREHFRFPFNDAFMDVIIDRMTQNQQFCERVLDDEKFGSTVRDLLVGVVYDRLREHPSTRA